MVSRTDFCLTRLGGSLADVIPSAVRIEIMTRIRPFIFSIVTLSLEAMVLIDRGTYVGSIRTVGTELRYGAKFYLSITTTIWSVGGPHQFWGTVLVARSSHNHSPSECQVLKSIELSKLIPPSSRCYNYHTLRQHTARATHKTTSLVITKCGSKGQESIKANIVRSRMAK